MTQQIVNRRSVRVAIGAVLLLSACRQDFKAEVESNTSWSGSFGGASVDGSGNRTVDLPDEDPQCVAVQKTTRNGSLSVRVVVENGGFLGVAGPSSGEWVTTTAEFGVVTACSGE